MSEMESGCPEHLSIKEIEELYPTKRCPTCENNAYQAEFCTCQLLVENIRKGVESNVVSISGSVER